MRRVGPGERVLLTYSGGLDSTYTLWRLLHEGFRVVALHVNIRNLWGRDAPEEEANRKVRAWLDEQGLRAEWMTAGVEYGNVVSAKYTRTVEIARFYAGMALRRPELQDVKVVVASGIAEDPHLSPAWVKSIHQVLEGAARRPVSLWRPVRHLPKAHVMADMPPGLRELAWFCDHPDGARPCRKCHTCKMVAAGARGREKPSYGKAKINYQVEG